MAFYGVYAPGTGTWVLGHVGDTARYLHIRARVNGGTASTNLNNVVAVTWSSPIDTTIHDNVDTVTVTPTATDVSLTKYEMHEKTTVMADHADSLIYQIVVENYGPGVVTNVVVRDTVPAHLTFVGHQATDGSFSVSGGVGTWTIDTIGAYGSATLSIQANYGDTLVVGDSIVNRVRIVSMDQTDSVTTNDTASYVVVVVPNPSSQDAQDMAARSTAPGPMEARPGRGVSDGIAGGARRLGECGAGLRACVASQPPSPPSDLHSPSPITMWSRTGMPSARPASAS